MSLNLPQIQIRVDEGEYCWDCEVSKEQEQELQRFKLRVDRYLIKCPTLAYGACKASYILKEIPDSEYMEWDHIQRPSQVRLAGV